MDDGCPISHLVIQYKPQGQKWNGYWCQNHILTDQETLQIADLSPGTWHDLLVTAHSDAGTTDAEYRFATLTLTGGSRSHPCPPYARNILRGPYDTGADRFIVLNPGGDHQRHSFRGGVEEKGKRMLDDICKSKCVPTSDFCYGFSRYFRGGKYILYDLYHYIFCDNR
ncbi:down syndrome cell adhesion molecule-like protein Dscam2 [Caerostris extrusa]|uniref:Down syndrome cell adhesion molecule-like protein Dscam2 n=1 Tax=Caerostris extrusa TaxID=172846 RepID=A0AAV4VLP0_CAEEX|nr:down syndrome cell adhesion molecule-like protein Dscam2 [Caerostris extrusa]